MKALRTSLFVVLMLVIVAFGVLTDSDEGPSLWHRWTFAGTEAGNPSLLKTVATIELPGPKGKRFDYLTIDYDDHYLLSAHLGAGLLYVIDTRTNQLVRAIPDVPGVEGVTYVPERKKAYTSDWYENKIGVVDLHMMKVVAKLPTEDKPDGSAYAAPFHKLYVSDERGKAEAIVDVSSDRVIKTLHFDSETGMPEYDPVAKKIYVNLQDDDVFAVIDPATDEVTAKFPVKGCKGNHGMALDSEHHRAFLSCEDNEQLAVFDLDRREVIATMPMAAGADVVDFDPGLGRIYVACYSGAISVFQEDDPSHFHKLGDVPVQRKVHSLAVDRESHRVYAPEETENGHPVARIIVFEAVAGKEQGD
jgi:YVTN family beta-propeller protein